MKIGFYIPGIKGSKDDQLNNFIVGTFLYIAGQDLQHQFLFITENELLLNAAIQANTQVINLRQKAGLLTKMRRQLELKQISRKNDLDLMVSINNDQLYSMPIPHCVIITNAEKVNVKAISKVDAVVVLNKNEKVYLVEKAGLATEKLFLIYPSAGKTSGPVSVDEKQLIQAKYSDGTEYFLYNSSFDNPGDLVNLLKSFSQFKKRQQTGFKLLITLEATSEFDKKLADYKYGNDVKFVGTKDSNKIIAAAYAAVLPFSTNQDIIAALNAMRSGVPVIAPKDSIVNEISDEAILQAETNSIKDIADKMMQIYTDENNRSILIQKGKAVEQYYTQEKAANDIWQAILKALN